MLTANFNELKQNSLQRAVALLVFLPAATRTWIIAPDFLPDDDRLWLARLWRRRARAAALRQESQSFRRLVRGRHLNRHTPACRRGFRNLCLEDQLNDLLVNHAEHLFEHAKAFAL